MKRKEKPLKMERKISKEAVSSAITQKILNDFDGFDLPTPTWINTGTAYAKQFNDPKPSKNILAFDFDGTISKDFNTDDLLYSCETMEKKIKEYILKDYTICLFSNQKGIIHGKASLEQIQNKMEQIFTKQLIIPITCIFSTTEDFYRKPLIGMLELFEDKYNGDLKINKLNSIFVGDAAGRKKSDTRKRNDFSDSDYKFALNAGINFQTPEQFFLNSKESIPKIELDLHKYDNNNNEHIKYPSDNEIILLIGSPGSGKSTFAEKIVEEHKDYVRISRDDLKTEKKCLDNAEKNVKENKSVIIDCTNPQKAKRAVYINLAKKLKVKIRAFLMDVPKEFALHLNDFRKVNPERKPYSPAVNAIPIHTFYKYFEEPTKEEGFDEVVKVNFVPGPFVNERERNIFYMYSS